MTTQQTLQTEEYKQTELGELPKGWEVVKLGDYCKIFSGFAFKSKDFVKEGVFVVKIGNIQNGTVSIDKRTNYFPKEKIIGNIKKFILKKDDILIALTGATTGKVGVVPKEYENSLLNQRVGKFDIFSKELDNNFFRYFSITKEFQEKVLDNLLKSAQGNVSPKQIENIKIPLPPLPEQQKIAYVLSTIQNAQEKTDNYINALKELKKSTMKHLFTYGAVPFDEIDRVELKETEIGKMPKEWGVVKLGDVFDIQQGKQLSSREDKTGKVKIPFLRTSNILWGGVDLSKIDYMFFSEKEVLKLQLKTNDVLVCEGGDVGRTALWKGELQGCLYQNHLHRLRPKDNFNSEFFVFWMQYAILTKKLYIASANRTTIPNISSSRLKEFLIPMPKPAEQKQISDIISDIDEKINAENKKQQALNELFNSLMKDLMTAKVRVNDLNINAVKLASLNKNEVVDVMNNLLPADQSIDYSRADSVMSLMGQMNDKINSTTKEEVEENIKKTKEWLKIAEDDLDSSKILLKQNKYRKSMQDLQQAVEKLVKAYCVAFNILPDKEVRDISHKTPLAFIKMVKREWVAPYVEVLKQRHPELNTDTKKLEETIHKKDDELANINEQTLGTMLDMLDKIEIALAGKNDEVKGFIKKITDEFGDFMEERQKKNIDFALGKFDMRLGCAFMNLYILSAVTYPHFMSRYPDDKIISLTSYDDNLAVIKHAERIFKMMDNSIYQLKNYLEIQNGKDWN